MACYYCPQYINQNNILWWEKEEVRFVFGPFIIFGLVFGQFLLGILASAIVGYLVTKARKGKPEGYIKHVQYFKLPYSPHRKGVMSYVLRNKTFPDSSVRHITG